MLFTPGRFGHGLPDLKGKKVYANWPANKVFNTLANEAILNGFGMTMNDMDEALAYTIVRTLIENINELTRLNPDLKDGTLNNATIEPVAPYHPGAVKYFKEKGVWTKEMEATQAKLLEMAR